MRNSISTILGFMLFLLPAITLAGTAVPNFGERKVAFLLVNFQDDQSQPISLTAAHSWMFNDISNYYREASYNQTYFSGNTFGWFTIPVSKDICNADLIYSETDKAATAAGINLSLYSHLVYLSPDNACSVTGQQNGSQAFPARTYLNISSSFSIRVMAHEMGHNFGLSHSQLMSCGDKSFGTLGVDCQATSAGYGNPTDVMGSGNGHFNAGQKELLGWITPNSPQSLKNVSASGTYTITPLSSDVAGIKALKIPRGIDSLTQNMNYYYVEYRQPIGHDASLAVNLTNGVLITTQGDNQYSYMLDMTPNSYPDEYNDSRDAALQVGRTYADNQAGVSIKVLAVNASGATVEVQLQTAVPSCVRSNPILSMSPSSQSTSVAGTSLNYTLTVVNKDSSNCAASTINLSQTVPSGFSSLLSALSVNLAPGASQTINLSVASSTSSAAGTYNFSASAVNSASNLSASASGSYVISAPKKGGGKPRR